MANLILGQNTILMQICYPMKLSVKYKEFLLWYGLDMWSCLGMHIRSADINQLLSSCSPFPLSDKTWVSNSCLQLVWFARLIFAYLVYYDAFSTAIFYLPLCSVHALGWQANGRSRSDSSSKVCLRNEEPSWRRCWNRIRKEFHY